jgi:transcriptional regulator with XRE-family HTH domain
MAKIKVRPHPGALSDQLKRQGITQVDANERTGVDRKTLAKIERGEEVKLKTLEQLANGLRVPISFLLDTPSIKQTDPPVIELIEEAGEWTRALLTLRELDTDSLSALLQKTNKIEWHLYHLRLVDEKVEGLLEQFGQAVEQLHLHFHYPIDLLQEEDTDPFTLNAQLNDLKKRRAVARLMEQLAGHRLSIFGGDYIQWHVKDFGFIGQPGDRYYDSTRILALSVEQSGTRSRPISILPGSEPPKFAPETEPPTQVFVDGVQLPPFKQEGE